MKKENYRIVLGIFFFSALLTWAGCEPAKVTGGGWIPSASSLGGKAIFGFNVDSCAQHRTGLGRFNYHDKNAGVKMNGYITQAGECVDGQGQSVDLLGKAACDHEKPTNLVEPFYKFTLYYTCTNPKSRKLGKGGQATVFVQDNGEGGNVVVMGDGDYAHIVVDNGPYEGYTNAGTVQGNIQSHACKG